MGRSNVIRVVVAEVSEAIFQAIFLQMVWGENMRTIFQVFVLFGSPHPLWVLWAAPASQSRSSKAEVLLGRPTNWTDSYAFQKVSKGPQTEKGCWHFLSAQGHSRCLNACPIWNTASPLCLMLPWPETVPKLTSLAYPPPETCVEVEHLPSCLSAEGTVGVMVVHPFSKSQLPMAGVPLPSL